MSAPQPPLVNGEIYHIYNRGVEKRTIFTQTQDYWRFLHDLFAFNDANPPLHSRTRLQKGQNTDVPLRYFDKKPRKLLVEILVFCLMPNHFHLMVRQRVSNGITTFMRKLGTGYTNYFNTKYERVGPLFQGIFKAVPLEHDAHFFHLPHYIHANPLALFTPSSEAKDKQARQSIQEKIEFLKCYRWSSLLDYIGQKNFPSVTQREPLLKLLGNPTPEKIEQEFVQWLNDFSRKKLTHMLSAELHETALDLQDENGYRIPKWDIGNGYNVNVKCNPSELSSEMLNCRGNNSMCARCTGEWIQNIDVPLRYGLTI